MNLFELKKKIPTLIGMVVFFGIATICSVYYDGWYVLLQALKIDVEILAVAIGGGWALYLFLLQRQNEPAIGIKFGYKCISNGDGLYLTFFDVTLNNIGKVRVQGRRSRNLAYPINGKDHKDEEETLKFGGSLLLRPVPLNLPPNTVLDWFNQESGEKREQLDKLFFGVSAIEADLLYDYARKEEEKEIEITDFWMEPGEAYDVGVCVVLPPGAYYLIITFLGEKSDDELWRRKVVIQIPNERHSLTNLA